MKLNSNMAVLFWLKKQKTDDHGKAPIYCRITINGIRSEFSTGQKIEPSVWLNEAGKVDKKSPGSISINEDLETIKGDLRKIYNQLTAVQNYVTAELVKNTYTAVKAGA